MPLFKLVLFSLLLAVLLLQVPVLTHARPHIIHFPLNDAHLGADTTWHKRNDPSAGGALPYSTPSNAVSARTENRSDTTIVVNAINLRGFNACSAEQQRYISDAFNDAAKLAGRIAVMRIDWNGRNEIDWFGNVFERPEDQAKIRRAYEAFARYNAAWTSPNPRRWHINVRCEPDACKYAQRISFADDFRLMVFCPEFFRLKRVDSEIRRTSGLTDPPHASFNMDWYQLNTATDVFQAFTRVKITHNDSNSTSMEGLGANLVGIVMAGSTPNGIQLGWNIGADSPLGARLLARGESLQNLTIKNAPSLAYYALGKFLGST
ncbi:hypothetical protein BDY21DRAFT_341433 [Lineolata rhizophorae]|uniref:Uncharacterized protein n=1 Tax=Lineolata rhizophorae TaxID=578093 RepID=A0A6A6P4V7_9PEZI|nr:hypothetical protein BDY21DRAFT_341433 [Lineolata rhizophorae]